MFTIQFQLNDRSVKALANAHVIIFAPYFMKSMLVASIAFIYMGLFVFDSNIVKIIMLAFGCWTFMIGQYPSYKQRQNLKQVFNDSYPSFRYDFAESKFSVSSIGNGTYSYSDIDKLFVHSIYLLILLHSTQLLLIDTSALSKEEVYKLKSFLVQKSSKKWRRCSIIRL